MHTLTVRLLGPSDLARARRLNALFAEVFEDPDSYARRPPDDGYFARLLALPHVIVLVAEDGDAVVGGLVAYDLPKLEQPRSEVYLYDLAVAATHRRQGIATALIARLRALAHARGAWVVYVQADRGDDPAIALYSGLGQREEVLHFDLPVP